MSTTRGHHLIGQVIGSYILEKLLGYGGSSAVFLAQNQLTHEKAAVKIFLPRSTMDKQGQKNFYRRFLREGSVSPQFCFPLQTGREWGNIDIPWRVEPARRKRATRPPMPKTASLVTR